MAVVAAHHALRERPLSSRLKLMAKVQNKREAAITACTMASVSYWAHGMMEPRQPSLARQTARSRTGPAPRPALARSKPDAGRGATTGNAGRQARPKAARTTTARLRARLPASRRRPARSPFRPCGTATSPAQDRVPARSRLYWDRPFPADRRCGAGPAARQRWVPTGEVDPA